MHYIFLIPSQQHFMGGSPGLTHTIASRNTPKKILFFCKQGNRVIETIRNGIFSQVVRPLWIFLVACERLETIESSIAKLFEISWRVSAVFSSTKSCNSLPWKVYAPPGLPLSLTSKSSLLNRRKQNQKLEYDEAASP